MKKCFQPEKCSKADAEIMQQLHSELIEKLKNNMKEEIKVMLDEEKIEKLLTEFEELIKSSPSSNSQVAWRPTAVPRDDVAAQLVPAMGWLKAKLEQYVTEIETENDRLCRQVTERRRLVENLFKEAVENRNQLTQLGLELEDWRDLHNFPRSVLQ